MNRDNGVVLLTDRAWPDDDIERRIITGAGFELVAGPADPASSREIEHLVESHDPIAIMTCWADVSADAINRPTKLGIVARLGVGLDNIDVNAASARGAYVTNVPDYCIEEVSDHAVGLVLDRMRGISAFDRDVRAGTWNPAGAQLSRLRTKTVGIVGYGRIGRSTARKLGGFGCRILARDPHFTGDDEVEAASMEGLLAASDIVILHLPLTADNHHLVGAEQLATMRPGALLVNVSRGGLVDTAALVDSLESGHLGGAALDVLEEEPNVNERIRSHPAVVITPHVAFSSDESVAELRTKAATDVVRVLRGESPAYPCNTPAMLDHTVKDDQ